MCLGIFSLYFFLFKVAPSSRVYVALWLWVVVGNELRMEGQRVVFGAGEGHSECLGVVT